MAVPDDQASNFPGSQFKAQPALAPQQEENRNFGRGRDEVLNADNLFR